MTDPSTVVSASGIVADVSPYIDLLAKGIAAAAVTFAAALIKQYIGIALPDLALNKIKSAASSGAGRWAAEAEGDLSKLSLDVHSAPVKKITDWIVAEFPATMTRAGADPDKVAAIVLGEIGKVQAQIAPTPVIVAPDHQSPTDFNLNSSKGT